MSPTTLLALNLRLSLQPTAYSLASAAKPRLPEPYTPSRLTRHLACFVCLLSVAKWFDKLDGDFATFLAYFPAVKARYLAPPPPPPPPPAEEGAAEGAAPAPAAPAPAVEAS